MLAVSILKFPPENTWLLYLKQEKLLHYWVTRIQAKSTDVPRALPFLLVNMLALEGKSLDSFDM